MVNGSFLFHPVFAVGLRTDVLHIPEAEQYKAEDEAAASRIQAKNGLETYSYNLRNSVEGDLKDKLEPADKEALDKAISETISWLDASAEGSKEEYEEKQSTFPPVPSLALPFTDSFPRHRGARGHREPDHAEGVRCWRCPRWRSARRLPWSRLGWIPRGWS